MLATRSLLVLAACAVVICAGAMGTATAGNKVTVGRSVASDRRVSIDQIDHASWDALLKKYVDTAGGVNYKAWKKSASDMAALDRHLGSLSQAEAKNR